jgi:MFS family permease
LAGFTEDKYPGSVKSAMILMAAGIGALPDALFLAWMADRIGRRKVFIATRGCSVGGRLI